MPSTTPPAPDPTLRMLASDRPFPSEPDAGSTPLLRAHGVTNVGRKREDNEDHFIVADIERVVRVQASSFGVEPGSAYPVLRQAKLLIVADGIGGHDHGDVASAVATDAMLHAIASLDELPTTPEELGSALEAFVGHAQDRIVDVAKRKGLNFPGTTLTMAYVAWPKMYVAHAGDSRCYLLRDGILKQLTQDHTMAARLVEAGLPPEQAEVSRTKHILVNALGGGTTELRVDFTGRELRRGDRVLLCSDGLSDLVADNQIQSICEGAPGVLEAANELVAAALAAGGTDNVTAVVMNVEG